MKKGFIAFVLKEILHIVRDPRTLLIALLIPVVQMILFGFAISTDVNNIDVAVAAPEITTEVESKVARIAHNPYFTFKGYIGNDEVDDCLRSGRAEAVIVFSRDYGRESRCQLVLDGSNPTTAQTAAAYLSQALSDGVVHIVPEVTILFNPRLSSSYNFVQIGRAHV